MTESINGAPALDQFEQTFDTTQVEGKHLTFWVDHQLYGMPIDAVVQIVGVHEIVSLPEYPEYVKGIINLRGSIIPIIDVRIRFHKEELSYNERTCIIVTSIADKHVGFVVDSVDEVCDIQTGDIVDTPTIASDAGSTFLTGVGKLNGKIVLLLDVSKMIDSDKILSM